MAREEIAEIIDNFAFLDDWEDRYKYVIELGDTLEDMPEADKTPATKVNGCVSQVWLTTDVREEDGAKRIYLRGDSDAHIVRGLVAIAIALYNGLPVDEAAEVDPETTFAEIGLREHLTQQRSNGLTALIKRIRGDAAQAAA